MASSHNRSPPGIVAIGIEVDDAGFLVGGVPGDDFSLVGEVDLGALGIFSGDLLTGEVSAFGFRDSGGTTDDFEFEFIITGGKLATLFATQEVAGGTFDLSATIDEFGVATGGTLVIDGTVASLGFLSGTLLTGTLTAFGFLGAGGDPFPLVPCFKAEHQTLSVDFNQLYPGENLHPRRGCS